MPIPCSIWLPWAVTARPSAAPLCSPMSWKASCGSAPTTRRTFIRIGRKTPRSKFPFPARSTLGFACNGKAVFENNLAATKDKISISLRGKIKNIGSEKLDEIFVKTPYMQAIYPGDTRAALEVFCLYDAEGDYFDLSDPPM